MSDTKFSLYDDNGEKCTEAILGNVRTVEQLLESVMSKDFIEKSINPNAVRYQMFYLGDENFQAIFRDYNKAKKKKQEEMTTKLNN